MGRQWYEVRVRERLDNDTFVKKSKFFFVPRASDAAHKYRGSGYIMSVQKVEKERLLGVGEFFKLGDELLRELRSSDGQTPMAAIESRRGYYGRASKEAADRH